MPVAATENGFELNFHEFCAELADLDQVTALLGWDQQTFLPPAADALRGQQLATMSALRHRMLAGAELERLLGGMSAREDSLEEVDRALLRVMRRERDRAVRLPQRLVTEYARTVAEAHQIWVTARRDADFAVFAPVLGRLVELARERAMHLGFGEHPYDAFLDEFDPGFTTEKVRAIFTPLRGALVDLLGRLAAAPGQPDDELLRGHWPEQLQEQFGREVAASFGFDFSRGRLDRAVHPFAESMGKFDVRLTTRYQTDFFGSAVFGVMHEAGHGMYEQGIADELVRTPLGGGASMALHESQSRLWENLVGRGPAFWRGAFPRLVELFPDELRGADEDAFLRAVNVVRPSLIRVEADEVTYNLHIMVRFELEEALLAGSLAVADLPEAWNARYHDYLGLVPADDASGVLQDVHWSAGLFGYFPGYALGNVMSVQIMDAARNEAGDLEAQFETGEFGALHSWLVGNIYRHGRVHEPLDLLRRATGSELDAGPYLAYLESKFGRLYGLEGSKATANGAP